MNRRNFIKRSTPWLSLPLLLDAMPIFAAKPERALDRLNRLALEEDKILVLVQLNGGNDGLNTIIPLDQYSIYQSVRANIALPEQSVLKLNNQTGIHPAMQSFHTLFNEGKLGILQSVSYPNPNFSHFRATDIWTSGSESDEVESSGWLGRFLNYYHPEFPENYPNNEFKDPLALTIGSVVSQTCQGPVSNMGLAVSSDEFYFPYQPPAEDEIPDGYYGAELEFMKTIMRQTNQYADGIQAAFNKAQTLSPDYPQSRLAEQLKIVARLINGGIQTRIFVVNIGGFDTHANQVVAGNTTTGTHANLLRDIADSVAAFMDDLKRMGVEDQVLGMTFSEFGRRIRSNNSSGTDHGAAAPLFVFGTKVNPRIHGANPTIPNNPAQNESVEMQYDYRDIYATLLQDWLGADESLVTQIFDRSFQHLPIINTITNIDDSILANGNWLGQNFPNPAINSTSIQVYCNKKSFARLLLYDNLGREISVLLNQEIEKGEKIISVDTSGLLKGIYHYKLNLGGMQLSKSMIVKK